MLSPHPQGPVHVGGRSRQPAYRHQIGFAQLA